MNCQKKYSATPRILSVFSGVLVALLLRSTTTAFQPPHGNERLGSTPRSLHRQRRRQDVRETDSFSSRFPTTGSGSSGSGSSSSSSSTRLQVFERMSEECIAALVSAQEQTVTLQLAETGCQAMMVGCMNNPESPALKRTLKQYGLTYRVAVLALTSMYTEDNDGATSKDQGWLSGFRAAKTDDDRPFGRDLKQCLARAAKLADQMASKQVNVLHVFLALLEYQENGKGKATAAETDAVTQTCTCGGWVVLDRMNVLTEDVTALDVCESLLKNLKEEPDATDKRELVTGEGSSSKTPTLAECGTDMTQQARDGLLDPVFGRDAEIRSCVRTLIRRRKNNVCLIGDAGVGKVCTIYQCQCVLFVFHSAACRPFIYKLTHSLSALCQTAFGRLPLPRELRSCWWTKKSVPLGCEAIDW